MKIYRNNIAIYDLVIDGKTTVTRRLMVENSLTLSVDSATVLALQIMDYVDVAGERYVLLNMPDVNITANGVYSYNMVLFGNLHRLENWLVEQSGNENYFYYGSAADHLAFILAAIATKETGWSLSIQGTITTGNKNIDYASMSCLSALHKFCEDFDCEFDVKNKIITVGTKIERPSDFDFAVGRGKGLYKISRGKASGQNIVTRMFGLGGKTNMLDGQRLTFEEKYVENNVASYGLREDKVVFEDIFPRRNGKITSDAVQVEVGRVLWSVTDSTMDFDLKTQIVEGAKIVFNTGDCAGNEFEISSYNHDTKTITFKEYKDEGQTPPYILPRAERYPKSGDEYVYIGIIMPDSYVVAARAELKTATQDEIAKRSVPQHPYTVDIDPRYIRGFTVAPACGDLVRISNDKIGLDAVIRIIGITFPVTNPSALTITVNDNVLVPSSVSMMRSVRRDIAASGKRFHPLMGNSTTPLNASNISALSATITKILQSSNYIGGLLGSGFKFDAPTGALELRKLRVWEELITTTLVKNEVQISRNESWFTDGGVVASVSLDSVGVKVRSGDTASIWRIGGRELRVALTAAQIAITLKEPPSFRVGDLLKAITEETGEINTVGFRTAYFRVDRLTSNGIILRMLNAVEPIKDMVLARVGNDINPSRQGSIYVDALSGYLRVLDGMSSFEVKASNITVQLGNLTNLSALGIRGDFPTAGLYAPGLVIDSKQVNGLDTSLSVIDGKIESKVSQGDFDAEITLTDEELAALGAKTDATNSRLSSSISQTAASISSLVTKTDTTNTNLSSSITQTAAAIESKVAKNGIVSSINQTAEAIKIAARLIELTGDVTIADAFIDKLVVNRLKSKNGKIDIKNDGTARIGDFDIDGSGTATIRNVDTAVSTFTKGDINTLAVLLAGNDVGSATIGGLSDHNVIEPITKSIFLSGSIVVNYPNTNIAISGMSVHCNATSHTMLGGLGASASASLYLVDDSGHSYSVAALTAVAVNGVVSDSKVVDFKANVPYAGTYKLRLDYSLSAEGNGAASDMFVTAGGTIAKSFIKANNQSQLGRGLAVIFDGNNHFYYGNNPAANNRKELVYKGYSDMPGVLAKARVTSLNAIQKPWGAHKITVAEGGTSKRLYHNIGNDQYTAICTPYGRGKIVEVISETATYVDVYATGDFNIQLIGDN